MHLIAMSMIMPARPRSVCLLGCLLSGSDARARASRFFGRLFAEAGPECAQLFATDRICCHALQVCQRSGGSPGLRHSSGATFDCIAGAHCCRAHTVTTWFKFTTALTHQAMPRAAHEAVVYAGSTLVWNRRLRSTPWQRDTMQWVRCYSNTTVKATSSDANSTHAAHHTRLLASCSSCITSSRSQAGPMLSTGTRRLEL
jgi:hypothetical protein